MREVAPFHDPTDQNWSSSLSGPRKRKYNPPKTQTCAKTVCEEESHPTHCVTVTQNDWENDWKSKAPLAVTAALSWGYRQLMQAWLED